MQLVAEIMEIRKRGKRPLAFVRTYGCQQNVADSEKIKGMLAQSGFPSPKRPTKRTSSFSIPAPCVSTPRTGSSEMSER